MTTVPTVDTFEHDIADEIRHKEASIEDIAAATGNIGNNPTQEGDKKGSNVFVSIIVILTLCGVVGASYVGYLYYTNGNSSPTKTIQETSSQVKKSENGTQISTISPTLNNAVGTYLTKAEKTKDGYSIEISSYSPVFAYMIKNENAFGDEIALAVGNTHTLKTASTTSATSTTTTSTSTNSTSTQTNNGSTTTNYIQQNLPEEYIFSDITISNQNMRVATSVYGTVAYAFIGTQKLVISNSTDGILALRSNILHK